MRLSDKERARAVQHGWKSSKDMKREQRAEERRAERLEEEACRAKKRAAKGVSLPGLDDDEGTP